MGNAGAEGRRRRGLSLALRRARAVTQDAQETRRASKMPTPMPTAARLMAAFSFFIVAFLAAEAFKPMMPEGTQFGLFSVISGGIGALSGWFVSGALAGRGMMASIGIGVRTSATAVFFTLVLFSGREMLIRAVKHLYHGPMDALQGMMALIAKYALLLANKPDLVILIGGGAVAGMVTEWASRRWR
jgi:hypothetical protein